MAQIIVYSYKRDLQVSVEIDNMTNDDYETIQRNFIELLEHQRPYEAISNGFLYALELCPKANPSDIWQHIIYRTYIEQGNNEQSWKRASGQGFEVAFTAVYNRHLLPHGIRLVVLSKTTAIKALAEMKLLDKIEPSKMDIAIEGNCIGNSWKIFGVIHGKTSLAERIKDDAPASKIIMDNGFLSIIATLDSKSFPPPHGDGVNHGELGGRTFATGMKENQPKRNYIEKYGDFTNCYSYNLRTPSSPLVTESGCRIKTLSFAEIQPDELVQELTNHWLKVKDRICQQMPVTTVV